MPKTNFCKRGRGLKLPDGTYWRAPYDKTGRLNYNARDYYPQVSDEELAKHCDHAPHPENTRYHARVPRELVAAFDVKRPGQSKLANESLRAIFLALYQKCVEFILKDFIPYPALEIVLLGFPRGRSLKGRARIHKWLRGMPDWIAYEKRGVRLLQTAEALPARKRLLERAAKARFPSQVEMPSTTSQVAESQVKTETCETTAALSSYNKQRDQGAPRCSSESNALADDVFLGEKISPSKQSCREARNLAPADGQQPVAEQKAANRERGTTQASGTAEDPAGAATKSPHRVRLTPEAMAAREAEWAAAARFRFGKEVSMSVEGELAFYGPQRPEEDHEAAWGDDWEPEQEETAGAESPAPAIPGFGPAAPSAPAQGGARLSLADLAACDGALLDALDAETDWLEADADAGAVDASGALTAQAQKEDQEAAEKAQAALGRLPNYDTWREFKRAHRWAAKAQLHAFLREGFTLGEIYASAEGMERRRGPKPKSPPGMLMHGCRMRRITVECGGWLP